MLAAISAGLISAAMSIFGKLATQSFFEAVLSRVMVYAGEQLAPMTTNTLDDELVAEIKKRLSGGGND
ncbi:MAG: hypothetical protein EPO42_13240 [Gallionellaceae bacterium]|nr:MAG: hypothetical protein EPO42_13240 [Gallionellaceae bacterium]